MLDYPIPSNEAARSATVDALDLMRREGDPFFAAATAQVRAIFDAPIAFVSLFSGETQTFLARENVPFEGTPRSHSLCAYTVAAKRTIVIPDTHLDPRSRDHPIVTEPPHVRFSASAPVMLSSGFCIGTVCAIDLSPRNMPSEAQITQLGNVASMLGRFYEVPLEPDAEHAARLRAIAAEAQEQFLRLVGHELRTPLNGIHGLAQMIEPADDDQSDILAALTASAERLNEIVENVIAFTDLTSGEMALEEAEVDPVAMIGALAQEHGVIAGLRGKTIRVGRCDPCTLLADPAKLELALSCLLSNVIAHGGSNAVLGVERGAAGLRITVADDGPGIAADREARIWEAFVVGDDTATRGADGIGLGLPLTRRIAEMHGAELTAISKADGLTATIHLPAWRVSDPS